MQQVRTDPARGVDILGNEHCGRRRGFADLYRYGLVTIGATRRLVRHLHAGRIRFREKSEPEPTRTLGRGDAAAADQQPRAAVADGRRRNDDGGAAVVVGPLAGEKPRNRDNFSSASAPRRL